MRDFDETLAGSFECDVKRFAASLVVAAQENGIKPARAAAAVTAGVEAYRRRMRLYATMPELDIWYDSTHADKLIKYFEPADRGQVSIHIEKKRRRRTSRGAFAKLTAMAHGRPRITEDPPVRVTISDDEQAELVHHLLAGYRLTLQEDRRSGPHMGQMPQRRADNYGHSRASSCRTACSGTWLVGRHMTPPIFQAGDGLPSGPSSA